MTDDVSNAFEWVSHIWGSQPRWTVEPSIALIEQLARQHLHLPAQAPCTITFFAEGGFNKLYDIKAPARNCLIRVALPVEPRRKTLSEVATIEFVRQRCTELVPRVLAYDACTDAQVNSLGFEWMIMEKLPGTVLEERWNEISWEAKEQLVKTLVGIIGRLHDHPLSGIGNIYPPQEGALTPAPTPAVDRIVAMAFFWDKHSDQDVPRGPFHSSHDWLAARLAFVLNDAAETLRTSEDEDDREEAVETQEAAQRLARLLPRLFPLHADGDEPERTIIHHDDLSFHNLLVDDAGRLTGIVDWECVSALPLWKACQLPSFLVGRARAERPDAELYAVDEDGTRELYDEQLREWELTQLRVVFLEEMERVRPVWVREHRSAGQRADFELALTHCDGELTRRRVCRWIDRVEEIGDELDMSQYVSLRDELFI
ncbi:kinase-like protein [Auriscalpium vulgare]|uniref:Kinase-like protein n=1 Tax=Auriscalpium vulgare TaxID=40419 RepID=A0ACB8RME1_9AGAM|nr:kinase-like protein [Auriscalpium vulgare]